MNLRPLPILSLFFLLIQFASCDGFLKRHGEESSPTMNFGKKELTKNRMGMELSLVYLDSANRDFSAEIDSILTRLENSAYTGISNSELSKFNQMDTLLSPSSELLTWMKKAKNWNLETNGAVEFTEKPLEDIWSFSASGPRLQDSVDVGYFLNRTGFSKVLFSDSMMVKPMDLKIDFSKISAGIALDRIASFLKDQGIRNFYLKMGASELANGVNENGELWKSSISYLIDSTEKSASGWIALQNKAISAWGDESNYYLNDSLKTGFILDPRTGYPANHGLLRAVVIGTDSETTDALADYLRISGKSTAFRLDSLRDDVQFLLIYHERGGKLTQYISPELIPFLSFPVN